MASTPHLSEKGNPPDPTGLSASTTSAELSSLLPSSSTAAPAPPLPAFHTRFACLQLSMTDRLRLINLPQADTSAVHATVAQVWHDRRGSIQAERLYGGSHEIQLYGNPWSYSSIAERVVPRRRLVARVLACLWDRGWAVLAATDVSCTQRAKASVLLRRRQSPAPSRREWCALSFLSGDLLVVSDAPRAVKGGRGLVEEMVAAMGLAGQRHRALPEQGAYEIKFKGYPWRAEREDTVKQRIMLITLLDVLERHGWSLYTSVQLDPGPEGETFSGADTWICQKEEAWEEDLPVYHA